MKTILKFLLLPFLFLLALFACKKEQPEILNAEDPCECASEVSADFEMGQFFKGQLISLDTIHMYMDYEVGYPPHLNTNCYVDFRAKEQNAESYEWQVGYHSNTINAANFGLYFSDTIGTIDVRLIVNSEPRKVCFPNDDGIDTIIKKITIKSLNQPPLVGTYYGYLTSNPSHYFNVVIDTFTTYNNSSIISYGIKNLPEGNQFDYLGTINTMSFEGVSEADGDPGTFYRFDYSKTSGIVNSNKELRVEFSAKRFKEDWSFEVLENFENEVFIGIKQ